VRLFSHTSPKHALQKLANARKPRAEAANPLRHNQQAPGETAVKWSTAPCWNPPFLPVGLHNALFHLPGVGRRGYNHSMEGERGP